MATNSRTLGNFEMPAFVPIAEYDKLNAVVTKFSETNGDSWIAFTSAWHGLSYRCRAMEEYAKQFVASVAKSTSPEMNERFRQDHDLFAFYASALSSIECSLFAAYCVGSLVDKNKFPITDAKHLRFTSEMVSQKFLSVFPGVPITTTIASCVQSADFSRLSNLRNVLNNRGQATNIL